MWALYKVYYITMRKMKKIMLMWAVAAMMLTLCACSTGKDNQLTYFSGIGENVAGTLPAGSGYSLRLQPDDELEITVSSSVPAATAMYNAPMANNQGRGNLDPQTGVRLHTYVVDHQGYITMPVLGKIEAKGKTLSELEQTIANRVKADVKDAYVNVRLAGYYVNVMGEVKSPQRVQVTSERFTVLDALAAAGDMTEYGKRNTLLVIREEDGKATYNRLDMTSPSLFASPYYYLQQNDVVYVEPNEIRSDNSRYNQNKAYKLSVISTIVSGLSVAMSLVIALAVKK